MIPAVLLCFGVIASAVAPHMQFVIVGDGVKMEVLDWEGTRRSVYPACRIRQHRAHIRRFCAQASPTRRTRLPRRERGSDELSVRNAEFRALTTKGLKGAAGRPQRTAADNASAEAYRANQQRIGMVPFPAAEFCSMYAVNPDGSVGKNRPPSFVAHEIDHGSIRKDYTGITVPVLITVPAERGQINSKRLNEILMEFIHHWEANLKHAVPMAHFRVAPRASLPVQK